MMDLMVDMSSGEKIEITNATKYSISDDNSVLVIEKNGWRIFFNFAKIEYVAKKDDLC